MSGRPLVDVRIEGLSTRGGVPPGVSGVDVHVRYGEFFTFLGPPKSGKSDVLHAYDVDLGPLSSNAAQEVVVEALVGQQPHGASGSQTLAIEQPLADG